MALGIIVGGPHIDDIDISLFHHPLQFDRAGRKGVLGFEKLFRFHRIVNRRRRHGGLPPYLVLGFEF